MRNFIIYLTLLLVAFTSKVTAQQTFESKAKVIADKIEKVTADEKEALKKEVEEVNVLLEKGIITKEQADAKKQSLAQARATIIENKVAVFQDELKTLVQDKVDGKIAKNDSLKGYSFSFPGMDVKNKAKNSLGERRTQSQLIFAMGANNLVTNGAVANSDYKYLRSSFMEWGLTWNTRILKDNNLLHFKYGFSWMYNALRSTDNRYFVDNNGQTTLATFPLDLRTRDSYFKNVFVTIPLHLEFDFSKKQFNKEGKNLFKIQQGFRLGIGGYVGYNTNSKQFLSYEVNGYRINERQKGNWNVNDWNYGLSAYVGYSNTSLYLKYDLNPMFKNNPVKQNNVSLGLRFDFN